MTKKLTGKTILWLMVFWVSLGGATVAAAQTDTLVWMSDTQIYADSYPETFHAMTKWIVENRDAKHVRYVLHTGDVIDNYEDPAQWEVARKALSVLEGHVPLLVLAGNHDMNHDEKTYDLFFDGFCAEHFASLPTFGGAYEHGKGRYDLLTMGDTDYILMSMGYGMSDHAIDWINEVLHTYQDRIAILCFHGYIDPDGSLTSDGERLYPDVVAANPNVRLVLCGHRHGVNHTTVQFDDNQDGTMDRMVYQFVADYQAEHDGGDGYLCLLQFDTEARTLTVETYSPYLNEYNCYDDGTGLENFTLPWLP